MRIECAKHRLEVKSADLSGSCFDDVNLSGSDFHNINMSGCSFDDLNMSGWRVHNVNLAGLRVEKLMLTQGAPFWATSVLSWAQTRGLACVSAERPMYRHPLFAPLLGVFAAFDYARRPFMRTSQMFVVLKRAT